MLIKRQHLLKTKIPTRGGGDSAFGETIKILITVNYLITLRLVETAKGCMG